MNLLGKLRNSLRLQWKALRVSRMPMENIKLRGSHPIQLLLNHIHRQEVSCSVQKKSSMLIKGFITNSGSANHNQTQSAFSSMESVRCYQLKESFQSVSCPKNCIRVNFCCYLASCNSVRSLVFFQNKQLPTRRSDIQCIALVGVPIQGSILPIYIQDDLNRR